MKTLIKGGRVIEPSTGLDGVRDILVEDSKILRIAKDIRANADKTINATDKVVIPGLVDMHVHLREPGREDKETVATGTQAALKGGVTSLLAMPNTLVPIDCVENVVLLKDIVQKTAVANVFVAGAITRGRLGKELTEIAKLKKEGVVALTDDGASVDSDEVFLEALKQAKKCGILVICHSEDKSLSGKGVVNFGFTSTRLGLRGIPKESEYRRVDRDIRLAEKIGVGLHIAHLSCQESIEIVAEAKRRGVKVTCETAPHYFSLSEEAALGYDTNLKMNPPLRSRADVEAIRQGLKNGIIDVIASDHAPHTENEKDIEFERAEFGTIGLETELAVAITELVDTGLLDWTDLVKKMALNPAEILGINKSRLEVGSDADLVVVSPAQEWVVGKEGFLSKSKNSAFLGRRLRGIVEWTICAGRVVYKL